MLCVYSDGGAVGRFVNGRLTLWVFECNCVIESSLRRRISIIESRLISLSVQSPDNNKVSGISLHCNSIKTDKSSNGTRRLMQQSQQTRIGGGVRAEEAFYIHDLLFFEICSRSNVIQRTKHGSEIINCCIQIRHVHKVRKLISKSTMMFLIPILKVWSSKRYLARHILRCCSALNASLRVTTGTKLNLTE